MLRFVVVAIVVACVSTAVVPKPPSSHSDVKNESPVVKSTPLHSEHHHPSAENHKAAEVKADVKQDNKGKSVLPHDRQSDKKENTQHHQPPVKRVDHHEEHHAAVKHTAVPVNVGHDSKAASPVLDAHKPENVDNVKAKMAKHGH